MRRRPAMHACRTAVFGGLAIGALVYQVHAQQVPAKPTQPDKSAKQSAKVMDTPDFKAAMAQDVKEKADFARRQQKLLEERYDLGDHASDSRMTAGRKPVQVGVRVKLPKGMKWDALNALSPDEIKKQNVFPQGFRPLPHVKHLVGGMVFPKPQIESIAATDSRDLKRLDIEYDLPEHLIPEFPPPVFLTTHPELGDVTHGQVIALTNYYAMFKDILTPVQLEGMRLLLTPFPQQQFNQTDDRKALAPGLGVACLDCHTNFHTNGAFHMNPDTRPQADRFRLDTVSLRGLFNQKLHGSKRSLRSVEDFTEFEQRSAYFDGDQVTASKKGINPPNRGDQVLMMAQMQNMVDFPPAEKLDVFGRLDPAKASAQERKGEGLFYGKARCSECHVPPIFTDQAMHDLRLERFYEPSTISDQHNIADGPIKTFTLRGIKDSPPYHHDGRLLTLDDTVEFFNLVLQTRLTQDEKEALVAFLKCL
jgi:cytochrome c peroxidase